jgi:hypothetical protein
MPFFVPLFLSVSSTKATLLPDHLSNGILERANGIGACEYPYRVADG